MFAPAAMLAFDSLACAPFALNLVRKITLNRSLVGDPIFFAHQVLDADAFAQLVQALCHRVEENIVIIVSAMGKMTNALVFY